MLTALARFQRTDEDTVPFGYARKPLGFTLVIDADGGSCRLADHYDDKGRALPQVIPNLSRTVKAVAFLGCDTAAYVLGRGKPAESAEKTVEKHRLFVDLVRTYHAQSQDRTAAAFLTWADGGRSGLAEAIDNLQGKALIRLDMDPVAIRVQGHDEWLHASPAARQFWANVARAAKAGGASAMCLVCGETKPTVTTFPQPLIGHQIAVSMQANVALASVNFPSASRGASGTGLRSSPICADCAGTAVQNLNYLTGSADHRWRSPAGDRGMVWWSTNPIADPLALDLFAARPEHVAELLATPRTGQATTWAPEPEDRFYVLTYSGNVSRLVIRRWIELPLDDLLLRVVTWFRETETPNTVRPHCPIFKYAESLGSMRREQGKWVTTAPDGSVEALTLAALAGEQVPRNFLRLAVARAFVEIRLVRSDDGLTAYLARERMAARVGLIRLILNRSYLKENPMPAHLDETRSDPAYVNGRLFAVRESLQHWALGNVNASIVDKYFERASSNPASIANVLEVMSKQHLNVLKRKQGEGARVRMDQRLTFLNAVQGDAPGRLSADQQAAWICGYYQQRQHDFESMQKESATPGTEPVADLSDTES